MKTRIFIPPLPRMTGGISILYGLAGELVSGGFDAALVSMESLLPGFPGVVPGKGVPLEPAGMSEIFIPVIPWKNLELAPDDIWLVPEGWPNALAPGLKAGARCVLYAQSAHFLFSALPEGCSMRDLPVSFVAISQPVAWFIEKSVGKRAELLRPGIDARVFYPGNERKAADGIIIAWMPRKNRKMAELTRRILKERNRLGKNVQWLEIDGCTQVGVAERLRRANVFFSAGYPEGFGLCGLEAMACGARVAGFAGFGGWDYMRQLLPLDGECPAVARPCPLDETQPPLPPNACIAPDGEPLAAALAVEYAALHADAETLERAMRETAARYGLETRRNAALALWTRAARHEAFPGPQGR